MAELEPLPEDNEEEEEEFDLLPANKVKSMDVYEQL